MQSRRRRGGFLAFLTTFALVAMVAGPARAGLAQRIDFPDLWPMELGEFQIVEPAASSGLPVTVTVDTPSICTYEAPYLTAVKGGLCQLTATQPGNEDWDPALPSVRSVTIDRVQSATLAVNPEMVYEPDETVVLEADVVQARPREEAPIPTGVVHVRIAPFQGEQVWDYEVTLNAEGTAHLNFNSPAIPLQRGSYAALFSYRGDDYYAPSYTETPALFDVASKTQTKLTVTPKKATWGDEFTFKATVLDAKTGKVPEDIEGTVDFKWPGGGVSADLENGRAELSTTEMAPGVNPVVAQYIDDSQSYKWGTSFDKTTATAEGLAPYVGYADGTGAVGIPLQPLNPISRGFIEPQFAAEGLPDGLTIDPDTGVISGTPGAVGTSKVNVTVEDAYEQFGEATFTIAVVKSNVSPKISYPSAKLQAGRTMKPLTPQVSGLSAPFTVASADLPPGLGLDAKSGTISGTPSRIGTFASTVVAKGAQGTATTQVSIVVSAAPPPATLSYPEVTGVAASPLSPVTPYVSGLTGAMAFTATGLPAALTVAKPTGVLSGTPARVGTSKPTATVKGPVGSAQSTFTISVGKTPLPRTLSYAKIKGQQGQRISPAVPHVTGLTGKVTYRVNGLPKGLRLNSGSGVISGKPTVPGKAAATVTATGANGSAKTKVTMRFAKSPDRPKIALRINGAKPVSFRLSARKSVRLVTSIRSPGHVHARVECRFLTGTAQNSLCSRKVTKKTLAVTVTPTCSTPAVRVTLRVTAHPTKKQSGRFNPRTWTRTWRVAAAPSVGCLPTP